MSNSIPAVTSRQKISQALAALETQRALLGEEVVETISASLREKLEQIENRTTAQRKQVTVLFADLVSFTAISGAMDAEEVVDLVNTLWERLDRVILSHGGTIDKHVGDGVMALFGAPVAQENDPEQAVLTGLAMQAELRDWVTEQIASGHPFGELRMRIGINTGPVLFGTVGSTGEVTAMGDTVNIASRLESASPVGGVLIAEDTWRQVSGRFDSRSMSIRVKGRDDPLTVYLVEAEKSASRRNSGRGVAGIDTRTIGREVESERIHTVFAEVVEESRARVVTILGEAGIGKSRLLEEFTIWLATQPQTTFVLTAKASADTQRHPYLLVRECIASKLQISNSTPGPLARERLIAGLAEIEGDDPGMAEFIGHLIGLDFSNSDQIRNVLGDAQQIRSRSFQYLARFFSAVCRDQPAVVLLEDIHWADSGSLDVVEYLGRECANLPLLFICLARPTLLERRPDWGSDLSLATILPLEPLSPEQSKALVGEILRHVQEIPAYLTKTITEAAGGNAFYIEELIKVLIEDGVIVPDAGEWRVQVERLGDLRVPPTLTAVLQARMDRLSQWERELLQRASVVGKIFWNSTLHFMGKSGLARRETDFAEQDAETLLSRLVQSEFIEKSQESAFEGSTEYHFRHAILHEVAYESVLLRRRRLYHQRVAQWLIEAGQDRAPEFAGLIGEHFARAGQTADASLWFAKAGHQAKATYLPEVAIEYYAKALDFQQGNDAPESKAQHQTLYYHLGEMLFWQARFDEAVTAFQASDQLAAELEDIGGRSQAWNQLSLVRGRKGEHREAIQNAKRAADFARQSGSEQGLIQALLTEASSLFIIGSLDDAQILCHEALSLGEETNLKVEIGQIHNLLGRICDARGDYATSMEYKEKALDIFRNLGDRRRTGWMLHNMGVVILLRGDYRAAADVFRDALQIAREIGDRDWEMAVLTNLGSVYVGLREYREAERSLGAVLDMTQGHDFYGSSLVYATMAEALLGLHRVDEAQRLVERALETAEAEEALEFLGYAWRVQGQICSDSISKHSNQKDVSIYCRWTCDECFEKSVNIFHEISAEAERARTLREWAIFETRTKGTASSKPKWQESRDIFQRLGLGPEVQRLDAQLAAWIQVSSALPVVV